MDWKGIRINKVTAEAHSDARFRNMSISMDITKIEKTGDDDARVHFTYTTRYLPDVADIKLEGFLDMGGKKGELGPAIARWHKDRILPREMFETMINLIKYSAETNGVLIAKALNIAAPIAAPKLKLPLKPQKTQKK